MVLFQSQKYQRLAELEARVQKAIEEAGGSGLDWAEDELHDAAAMAGFDLAVARVVDAGTLETVLGAGEEGSAGRCWLAAETLFIDGVVARAEGRAADARDRLEKARSLYGRVGADAHLPKAASSPEERLEAIEGMLE